MTDKDTSIAVVLASKGRPIELAQRKNLFLRQSRPPKVVVYSVAEESDLPDPSALYPNNIVVFGSAGSTIQRNRGMDHVPDDCQLIVFLDDDFIPANTFFEDVALFFHKYKEVAGANGALLADGINSAGIDFDAALKIVQLAEECDVDGIRIEWNTVGLYGCNMVFRRTAIGSIRFDERLPLYGWQEDIDFAARVARYGCIVKTNAFFGLHQGVKGGRTSGVAFGYSQIANPIYLMKKGTMPPYFGFRLMCKNILSNHVRIFYPEPWVDRKGRAEGNWLAFIDLVRGRLDPERVLKHMYSRAAS